MACHIAMAIYFEIFMSIYKFLFPFIPPGIFCVKMFTNNFLIPNLESQNMNFDFEFGTGPYLTYISTKLMLQIK